ncbi:MAG: hypothetical protein V7L07_09715 [Nostoc sp.]
MCGAIANLSRLTSDRHLIVRHPKCRSCSCQHYNVWEKRCNVPHQHCNTHKEYYNIPHQYYDIHKEYCNFDDKDYNIPYQYCNIRHQH